MNIFYNNLAIHCQKISDSDLVMKVIDEYYNYLNSENSNNSENLFIEYIKSIPKLSGLVELIDPKAMFQLRKAFQKSVYKGDRNFFDTYIKTFMDLYPSQYGRFASQNRVEVNIEAMILSINIELYTIYRFTVAKWDDAKINRCRITEKCKNTKSPINIILYMGATHIDTISEFFNRFYKSDCISTNPIDRVNSYSSLPFTNLL
jgi:hypothetical protein